MEQEGCYGDGSRPWCSISLVEVSYPWDSIGDVTLMMSTKDDDVSSIRRVSECYRRS